MQNNAVEFFDLLIPANAPPVTIVRVKDHSSIKINIAEVDETTGRMTAAYKTYAICGAIRIIGESDDSMNRLAKRDEIISQTFSTRQQLSCRG